VTRHHSRSSMLVLFLLAAGWFALGSSHPAGADVDEPSKAPAVAACQSYATSHYKQVNPEHFVSIQLLEEDVNEKKYEAKVGTQLVSTVLSGRGIWQDKAGGPSNVRFTCLLENAKPVFVDVAEDGRRDPVDVCWDGFQPSGWAQMSQCLQDSLKKEEAALADLLTKTAQQAEQTADKISAKKTLQESNAQWVKYRDSECARQQAFVAGRNHPDIPELTCTIRETAERMSDLRFDE
jgi:uncharacterized protein YecT (DUF1311 family)